jgi:hypothetical protein
MAIAQEVFNPLDSGLLDRFAIVLIKLIWIN